MDPRLADQVERPEELTDERQLGRIGRLRAARAAAQHTRRINAIAEAQAKQLAEITAARAADELAEERRVHALQVADEERARAARIAAENDTQAVTDQETKRSRRYQRFAARRSLVTTVVIIVLSLSTAIPAQVDWFLAQKLGFLGVTLALLIELLCWLGAFLYADAVDEDKAGLARLYRTLTWVFAGIAATINFAHGATIHVAIGIGYAIASLMGVGAFEVYMHRTRHRKSGLSAAEIRLIALRRWTFPKIVREQARLRATFGLGIPDEMLWRMAYQRVLGNPTIPVPISALFVREPNTERTDANTPGENAVEVAEVELTPEPSSPDMAAPGSVAVMQDERPANTADQADATVEVPVDWADVDGVDDLVAKWWPNTESEQAANTANAPAAEASVTSANTANTESEVAVDPWAPIPADLDDTVPLKARLRGYYERVRSLGVAAEDLSWQAANWACGGSERYAQMALKDYRAELATNTTNDNPEQR